MEKFYNIDDCIKAEQESIGYYTARIEAWENVIIKTKKDGSEFAELSNRCIDGAKIYDKSYSMQKGEKELSVTFRELSGRWENDTIDCCGYCDELPETDERSEAAKHQHFIRVKYQYTPEEMRGKIAELIEKYKTWKKQNEEAKAYLEKIKEDLENDIRALKEKYLTEAKGIDRSIKYHTAEALKNMWLGYRF